MSEQQANEDLVATYGRYADERARWAQVLGTTGARKNPAPKPSSSSWFFIATNLVLWFVVLPLVSYLN